MHETAADLQLLQALLDESISNASPFLRRSFGMPERSMSAQQLVDHLQGSVTVALATVTAGGEPRVAPINALFVRGSFCVPTVAEAARTRHLSRRPGVSLTYFEGTALAVIVHGLAMIIGDDHPEFAELDEIQTHAGRQSPREWQGHAVFLKVEAARMYTYAGRAG